MSRNPDVETPGVEGSSPGATASQPQPGSASDLRQSEAPFTVINGGRASAPVRSLTDLPIIGAWLKSANLIPTSFDRAERTEFDQQGYPRAVAWVSFKGGKMTGGGDITLPDDTQRDAMERERKDAPFPKPTTLVAIADPPDGVNLADPNVAICHDFDGRIGMIHQRYDTRDGGKGFIPWTPCTDGAWHKIEPDPLPFYGLPGAEKHSTLFVHEGAKAAARVKRIISGEDNSAFPWREEMRWGHHIGWLGGVRAVHRSDWRRLARMGWKRVVICADNDPNGKAIVPRIARFFACKVQSLLFTDEWPLSFDLGDDWPEGRLHARIGPLLRPATWATEEIERDPGERGAPSYRVTDQFRSEWAYSVAPRLFFHRDAPGTLLSEDEFNATVAPCSHLRHTASKLMTCVEAQVQALDYDPGKASGEIAGDRERRWNCHEPTSVKPIKGDPAPFLDFVAHLLPIEEDRREALRWIATLVARPAVRMRYSMLLISKRQGVGKTTLGTILAPLVGRQNASFVSEQTIIKSQFTGWIARKRLIVVNEIYTGQKRAAYDLLKKFITDDTVECNEKHIKTYDIPNWAVFLACSNSDEALYLDEDDRRWFVPTVTDQVKPREWWEELHRWLAVDGPGIILDWARHFGGEYVSTGDIAPRSTLKASVIDASRSEGRALAREVAERLVEIGEPTILLARDVRAWIASKRGMDLSHSHLEKPRTIISEMVAVEGVRALTGDKRPATGSGKEAVVMNFTPANGETWKDFQPRLKTMKEVGFDEQF